MERVRIRSMINQIKSTHASQFGTKKMGESYQISTILQPESNCQDKTFKNNSCFNLESVEEVSSRQEVQNNPEQTNRTTRSKQTRKRSRKISNRSFLSSTINHRGKEEFENLQELGIQSKKIIDRDFRKTETAIKIDEGMISLFTISEVTHRRQKKKYVKPPIEHQFLRKKSLPLKNLKLPHKESSKISHSQQIKLPFGFNFEKVRSRVDPLQNMAKNLGLTIKIPKTTRKSSDITPWQFESPTIARV